MAPQSAMASSQNINEEADHNRDWETWKKVDGIKFKPTAEVLIFVYLAGMVSGSTDGPIFPLIQEVDVYQYEPSKLKSKAHDFGDGKVYFFSRVQKKYKKGSIHHRKAKGGFWKTGKCNPVRGKDGDTGTERSLTYYRHDPESGEKPIKTHWLMREYMLLKRPKNDNESMALCVVYFHGQRDNEDKQSSHPDVEEAEGSPTRNMSTTEVHPGVSRDRQRCCSYCSSNNPPLIHSSSNLEAVTLEETLPSSYSYSNMPNIGSCVDTADESNVFALSPNCYPPLNSTPNPAAITFEQPLFFPPNSFQNMTDITNASWGSIATALNNNFPLYSSNLNPAASTPELPSSNSFQNMNNMMGVSSAAPADSNINTPNNCRSTLAELDPQNWVVEGLEADGSLYQYSSNDDIQPLDQDLLENDQMWSKLSQYSNHPNHESESGSKLLELCRGYSLVP